MRMQELKHGDTRIKEKFLIFPMIAFNQEIHRLEKRWWEKVKYQEVYIVYRHIIYPSFKYGQWERPVWIDKKVGEYYE